MLLATAKRDFTLCISKQSVWSLGVMFVQVYLIVTTFFFLIFVKLSLFKAKSYRNAIHSCILLLAAFACCVSYWGNKLNTVYKEMLKWSLLDLSTFSVIRPVSCFKIYKIYSTLLWCLQNPVYIVCIDLLMKSEVAKAVSNRQAFTNGCKQWHLLLMLFG